MAGTGQQTHFIDTSEKPASIRKRIKEAFGWIKTVAGMGKIKLRGLDKVDWAFAFMAASSPRRRPRQRFRAISWPARPPPLTTVHNYPASY